MLIPNIITMLNLLSGVVAITFAFQKEYHLAFVMAALAFLFDFFDGTAARALGVKSELGKDLDSLADVVSFGVAPSLVLFNYWSEYMDNALPYLALALPLFAAYRLAIFNNSQQSDEYFKGLATPALSIMSYSIPIAGCESLGVHFVLRNPVFLVLFVVIGCYLMLSPLKFLSFKLGSKQKFLNSIRIAFALLCLLLVVIFKFFGVILCLLMYLIISLTIQKRLNTL